MGKGCKLSSPHLVHISTLKLLRGLSVNSSTMKPFLQATPLACVSDFPCGKGAVRFSVSLRVAAVPSLSLGYSKTLKYTQKENNLESLPRVKKKKVILSSKLLLALTMVLK